MKTFWTMIAIAGSGVLAEAQVTPRPAPAPKAATVPRPPAEPVVAPSPAPLVEPWLVDPWLTEPWLLAAPEVPLAIAVAPSPALAPLAPLAEIAWPALPAEPALAPLPSLGAAPLLWDRPQGQGPVTPRPPRAARPTVPELERLLSQIDREEAARVRSIEGQQRALEREIEAALRAEEREAGQVARAVTRDLEQRERLAEREMEQALRAAERAAEAQDRAAQRDLEMALRSIQGQHDLSTTHAEAARATDMIRSLAFSRAVTAPAPWAQADVADSLYQRARELFNRGEWGQAVQAFRSLPQRYPNSAYAPEAAYYQAFSLFRIGGTTELREALAALEASREKYPNARSRTEAATLQTRIRGVLASRGDAEAQAALRSTAAGQAACDKEEQAVQAEAMNALSRSDASNVNELITRVLARKDECSIPLRRTAVFLVGNRRDAQAVAILAGVARSDPSVDVRVEAIGIIGRLPAEEGVPVLEELTRSDDERVQRSAVRALVRHASARARTSVRALVEREDVSERVRSEALSAFDAERATADDIAWLRALYAKVTTPTLKARTLSAIVRVGGPEVDAWLVTIARDDNQPSEIRATAMRRIGETMAVADLGRLYDGATQQRFRSEIISVLGKRKEDAATDKLIDIIKNGTDPSLRRSAISAVASKNDARATQLLLEIINK